MKKWLLILFFVISTSSDIYANVVDDTLRISANSYFLLDSVFYNTKIDTTIILSENQHFELLDYNQYFYGKLQQEGNKNRVGQELTKLILANKKQEPKVSNHFEISTSAYDSYSGLKINRIKIKNQKLIGESVYDTSQLVDSKLINDLNRFHRATRQSVLRANLLFKSGDTINSQVLVDNEQLIRKLPYIENAVFYIEPIGNDSANIVLVVKDKIPYGVNLNIISTHKQSLKLWNTNLFGYGNEFGLKTTLDRKESPSFYLSQAYYDLNNLFKNFINGGIDYSRSSENEILKLDLIRNYILSSINLGGGLGLKLQKTELPFWVNNDSIIESAKYFEGNVWAGYKINLNRFSKKKSHQTYFIPSAGFYNKYFISRPYITADSNLFLENYSSLFTNLALVSQSFIRTDNFLNQDHVKDLPVGYNIGLTFGYKFGEYRSMPYFGISFQNGHCFEKFGYINTNIQFGTFLYRDRMRDGVFKIELNQASQYLELDRYGMRMLSTLNYTFGINRNWYDSLYLNNSSGISGLNIKDLRGEQRLSLNAQLIFYTPWKLIGFRFTPYLNFCGGFIFDRNQRLFNQKLISGIGLGFRLKNRYLVFTNIQIRFMYYMNLPADIQNWSFDISDGYDFSIDDFSPNTPNIFEFK